MTKNGVGGIKMNWAIIGGTVGVICGTLLVVFNKKKKNDKDNKQ